MLTGTNVLVLRWPLYHLNIQLNHTASPLHRVSAPSDASHSPKTNMGIFVDLIVARGTRRKKPQKLYVFIQTNLKEWIDKKNGHEGKD